MKNTSFIESPGQTHPARAGGRTNPKPPIRRLCQRLVSNASGWILGAVLCGGLAVQSAHGQVIFTRTTANGEGWAAYSATFTPTQSGNYTLGFNITATDGVILFQGTPHDDHSIYLDDVRVTGPGVSFQDGFESPVVITQQDYPNGPFGQWLFSNFSGVIPGSPSQWGSVGPYDGNQRGFVQAFNGTLSNIRTASTVSLVAGQTYTVTFFQASRSGPVGNEGVLTYTVTFDYVPPAPINWVNWTGSETVGGVTKYVGQMVVPRTGGGSTTVNVKYTPPTQQVAELGFVGIAFAQYSTSQAGNYIHDYWRQGPGGSLGRNPARSPYTSSKVVNIPDGGGAASDQWDIIALRFAGANTLDFTDASTGLPVSIASPIFAYVSLNGNGYGFDQDFDILSFGDGTVRDQGYFGVGTSFKSLATVNGATQYQLLGTGEPHGALQFRGSFSTVTWQSLSSEFWNGFTIGVAQLAADVPIANAGLDQTVTATSANGASVQLSGSVSGSTKTPFTFTWSGDFGTASGQNPTVTLPVGTHTITLKVTDAAGASDTDTVVITVKANPAPVINSPTTASGTYGTAFSYTISADNSPTSFNATGLPAGLSIDTSTGVISGTLPNTVGAFTITLSASNAGGTGTGTLTLNIIDNVPPVLSLPHSVTAEATSPAGATVTFSVSANDAIDGPVPVTLKVFGHDVGPNPSPFNFSGTFSLGISGITASAADHSGNVANGSFTITVQDTTPPVLTLPANQVLEATSAAGAVATFTASATDLVTANPTITYSQASGSTFPLGITSVTVTTKDAAGNASTGTFTITVRDTTPPVITSVAPSSAVLWPPNHKLIPITLNVAASDAVGVTSLRILSVTSNEPDNGLGDGDTPNDIIFSTNAVTVNGTDITGSLTLQLRAERSGKGNGRTYTIVVQASDAAGNASTRTVTVSVPKSQGS